MKKRKLKQPDGWLLEEYITVGAHLINGGQLIVGDHDSDCGHYTGRFAFEYADGRTTRFYTKKSAPKWLLAYYKLAVES